MTTAIRRQTLTDAYFGDYGGQYVPNVLLPALDELEQAYAAVLADPAFVEELGPLTEEGLTNEF